MSEARDSRTEMSSSTTKTTGERSPARFASDWAAADAKPHAGAVRFRREERVEDLIRDVRQKPHARITNRNKNLLVLGSLHPDEDLSRTLDVLHRFDAIDEQIHRDLLQLHAIPQDRG